MSWLKAIRTGLARSFGGPRLLVALWLVNLVVALPLAAVLGSSIHRSVAHSPRAEGLVEGFDTTWHGGYQATARGLEKTLEPSVVGVGAFLDNLEAWWTGHAFSGFPGLVAVGVLYALLWAFLLGGVLQRFARPEGFEGGVLSQSFFGNCGRFFGRFVRLALLSAVLYLVIYGLARWYFRGLQSWTRDVTSERWVLFWVLIGAGLVVTLLMGVRLVFDLAKVMTVQEDRRGMVLAVGAALRFLVARPFTLVGLYVGLALLWLVVLALYALVAPTAGPASWTGVLLAFLLAQVVLAVKIGLRLSLLAGETAVYQEGRAEG